MKSGELMFCTFISNFQNAYVEYKEIQAAQGVKIAAKELEKAIAGEIIFINGTNDALNFRL
jgi:translation initiation factor IF-2